MSLYRINFDRHRFFTLQESFSKSVTISFTAFGTPPLVHSVFHASSNEPSFFVRLLEYKQKFKIVRKCPATVLFFVEFSSKKKYFFCYGSYILYEFQIKNSELKVAFTVEKVSNCLFKIFNSKFDYSELNNLSLKSLKINNFSLISFQNLTFLNWLRLDVLKNYVSWKGE